MKKLPFSLIIVVLLSFVCGGAEATEANKAIARRYIEEIFNKGDMAVADELIAEDFVNHSSFGGLPPNREGLKQAVARMVAVSPNAFSIDDLIARGDKVVVRGTFRGIPAFTWTVTLRIEGAKITDHWATNDTDLDLMQQLGIIPSPRESKVNKVRTTLVISEIIASKVEDLVGIWETRFMGEVAYMQFKADGTANLAYTVEKLESAPIISGTFWFVGTGFNIDDNMSYGKGTYEVRVQKEGDKPIHLSFIIIEDSNNPNRARYLTNGMSRVEP